MKKTYQTPEALTICLTQILPLAASDPNVGFDPDGEVDAGDVGTKESKNIWDMNW